LIVDTKQSSTFDTYVLHSSATNVDDNRLSLLQWQTNHIDRKQEILRIELDYLRQAHDNAKEQDDLARQWAIEQIIDNRMKTMKAIDTIRHEQERTLNVSCQTSIVLSNGNDRIHSSIHIDQQIDELVQCQLVTLEKQLEQAESIGVLQLSATDQDTSMTTDGYQQTIRTIDDLRQLSTTLDLLSSFIRCCCCCCCRYF
jgi:hypothetical protein